MHLDGQYPKNKILHRVIGLFQGYPHQHKFMYDEYSLRSLLDSYGFVNITTCQYGESKLMDQFIQDVEFGELERYSNSLYIEAKK